MTKAKVKEVKKDMKGLETKESMQAEGKKSGITAKMNFQYKGKSHKMGMEVLGLEEKDLISLKDKGLI